MPNNFLITGSAYTSKAGSDSNNGTTKDTPKGSISSAVALNLAGLLVVGSGAYSESVSTGGSSSITGIVADGIVSVYGDSTMDWALAPASASFVLSGINFKGLRSVSSFVNTFARLIQNCTFEGITAFGAGKYGNFNKCIFINCNWEGTNVGTYSFTECIFINCNVRDVRTLTSCYANGVTTIRTTVNIVPANCDNNNLMGTIAIGDTNYQNLAAHRVSNPTLNVNSFNLTPKFNNVEKKDFTLQFDSPHIRVDGTNIGGTQTARSTTVNDAEWLIGNGSVWTGVEMSGNDIVLSPNVTVGSIVSAPIRTGANASEIEAIIYNGALNFNKSTAGGSTSNLNVPDSNPYAGNDATGMGSPDRLTYEMRWTLNETQPITAADWTNGNLLPVGNWGVFTYNTAPRVDNVGKSNGAVGYNPATTNPVNAIWLQFRITLRNNYL